MINLFEKYDEKAQDLENSLNRAMFNYKTVVLEDDGFLPPHVLSPISFFTGMIPDNMKIDPVFFNEVPIPYYWEIKGDNTKAEIFDGYIKKGHIHYSNRKNDFRIVQSVDWYNMNSKVRLVEHYNQYGKCFLKITYSDGQITLKTYLDSHKREVILHNQITGTVELNYQRKKYIFKNFNELILFYFEITNLDVRQVFYNNLGRPLFIIYALKKKHPNKNYYHKLFWQELSLQIPDNMMEVLTESNSITQQIIVQNKEEYVKIKNQIKEQNIETTVKVDYLGFVYELKNAKNLKSSALILTNSDNIEKIEKLIKLCPTLQFNIAALTNMSPKLLYFENFKNVSLFPSVSNDELEELLQKNSFYLDINHGGETQKIIRTAFENNLLILAFKETIHDRKYVANEHVFESNDYLHMVKVLIKNLSGENEFYKSLQKQLGEAGHTTIRDYQKVLGNNN